MAPGLRERKRRAAMRHIQHVALDLFDAHGFQQVSVEQIADAAEVSPSSVYRYFGTKEGIVLADDFDSLSEAELTTIIDPHDLVGTVRTVVARFEPSPDQHDPEANLALRRIRYFFDEPSVRKASYETLANAVERITPILTASGGFTDSEARVMSSALVFGYFSAVEQWYRNPADRSIADVLDEALRTLRRL
ncbi:TetR family transcriptional regulator [Propionibacterium freudenreichii]|nr:TetR/AcrR family transcriptional regulator [Propionibacterium freudenreichii]MCT2974589.1 TetR family transcriptional regulator [Propionibacterium freudenreichii]MCT2976057.1 TetR family transcriptional regulator [Propionibacterium freudenreichii]MCT2998773.1 TetR family transcriptional regulator [Propionibacterium freudenreichii]MCT3001460.1 TetR family transcriptional regulator [Propionibacterium freudenreichii]MCT3011666.1 TetR family transcriptional regulator [Propionibacterium freudenr